MRSDFLACALAGLSAVNAIDTITAKGAKFFTSSGNQFFVRGVAYQLRPEDPLIDNTQCKLDSSLMKDLGVNSIRVYHVDPDAKHDDCMKTFEDAGIYVWLDLDTFTTQIEQIAPHWNDTQLKAFQKVMDGFANYDNLAGFFVGNEVVTTENGTIAAPYVKAAGRDLKAYRDKQKYRKIPIGYSAADIAYNRPMLQNYFACGDKPEEALDFFGLNTYSWCGDSSYSGSGYQERVEEAKSLNIPIFITETGCNKPQPRTFEDQAAIFGEMASVYNGAIIYEWIQEVNDYGLITYGDPVDPAASGAPLDGYTRSGTPTPKNPDFTNLSNQWKTLTASSIKEADYNPSISAPACPSSQSASGSQWQVNGNVALPTVGQTYNAQQATQTGSGSAGATGTAANPSASATKGAAAGSPVREVQGMGIGLVSVLVGFFWWM